MELSQLSSLITNRANSNLPFFSPHILKGPLQRIDETMPTCDGTKSAASTSLLLPDTILQSRYRIIMRTSFPRDLGESRKNERERLDAAVNYDHPGVTLPCLGPPITRDCGLLGLEIFSGSHKLKVLVHPARLERATP